MDQLKDCSQSREVNVKWRFFGIQHPITVMRNAAARNLYTDIQREYNDRIKGRVARIIESLDRKSVV